MSFVVFLVLCAAVALALLLTWHMAGWYAHFRMQLKLRPLIDSNQEITSALGRYKTNSNIYNELHLARAVRNACDDPAVDAAVDYYWNRK